MQSISILFVDHDSVCRSRKFDSLRERWVFSFLLEGLVIGSFPCSPFRGFFSFPHEFSKYLFGLWALLSFVVTGSLSLSLSEACGFHAFAYEGNVKHHPAELLISGPDFLRCGF
ncbi:hypothetical protein VNO78_02458 [Psophocarpus tetragonolobus]|uniref:Uncharacterized protein n=1 Tax=Psophocarpus tetragonolobus TaxID=3891 RepID=A0AAN9SYX1_PSOTE